MSTFTTPGIVGSDEAAAAAVRVLTAFEQQEGHAQLVGMTDEELVAYVGDPQQCQPFGEWYPTLTDEQKQFAQTVALRVLTTRDQFALVGTEAEAGYVLPDTTSAVLHLRRTEPALTAHRQTSDGPAWWLLRHVRDGSWLRELTTPQGYRTFALCRLDDSLRDEFHTWMHVPQDAVAADVDTTVDAAALSSGQGLDFLEGNTSVTTVAEAAPGDASDGRVRVVHVLDGATFTGVPAQDSITYAGTGRAELLAAWDAWAGRW